MNVSFVSQSCHEVRGQSPGTAGRCHQGRDPRRPRGPARSRRPGRHRDAAGRRRGRDLAAHPVPLLPHPGSHVRRRWRPCCGAPRTTAPDRGRGRHRAGVPGISQARGTEPATDARAAVDPAGPARPLVAPAAAGGVHRRSAGRGDLAPAGRRGAQAGGGDRLPVQPVGLDHGQRGRRAQRGRGPARYRLGHPRPGQRAQAGKPDGREPPSQPQGRTP